MEMVSLDILCVPQFQMEMVSLDILCVPQFQMEMVSLDILCLSSAELGCQRLIVEHFVTPVDRGRLL